MLLFELSRRLGYLLTFLLSINFCLAQVEQVTLADSGRAILPVVTGPNASDETRAAADELAHYLGRISGGSFERTSGNGASGIVVGTVDDFESLRIDVSFESGRFNREDYILKSTRDGLYLIAPRAAGVQNAVWDLLYRFGYRQFFPTDTWEVVPDTPTLRIAIDEHQQPDYYVRRFWYGNHWSSDQRALFDRWQRRNRTTPAFTLSTGHAYNRIVDRNRKIFEQNPQFMRLWDGERGGTHFCISNPRLREVVVADAVARVNEDTDSISMEPPDNSQWCQCDNCASMGTPTDRAVILANEVAEAINALEFGTIYVGMYAYNMHSPPPSPGIELHPALVVNISTRFIRGGFSAEELIRKWGSRANMIGLREHYYSYRNLPGGGRAADINYLRRSIPGFYKDGARFSSVNLHGTWGPTGLGHYLMSRFYWDVSEADRADVWITDFITRSFESAYEPMNSFYRMIHPIESDDTRPLLSEDLLAQMYGYLNQARRLSNNPKVVKRIDDLILYTRHVELYFNALNAQGSREQDLYEQWIQHSYNMADRMMVHTGRMTSRHYAIDGGSVSLLDGKRTSEMRSQATAYTREQIDQILAEGLTNNKRLEFEPVSFSDDLVPAVDYLDLPKRATGSWGSKNAHRSRRNFLIWVDEPGEVRFTVTAGLTWQNRGNLRIALSSPEDALEEPSDMNNEVQPDKQPHEVVMHTPYSGLHTLSISDGDGRFRIKFPDGTPVTLQSGFHTQIGFDLYFYVPKGSSVVAGHVDSNQHGIFDGDNKQIYSFSEQTSQGMFSVEVPPGQDGKIWRARTWRGRGSLKLMTVPPYLAATPESLLIPREVAEADRR